MSDKPRSRYTFALVRERLRRHEGPYLDFALGRRRETLPEAVARAARDHPELATAACPKDELEAFCGEAAQALRRDFGACVEPAAILPAPGGRTAMGVLAATLIAADDPVVVTEPGYPVFARVARQVGARVLEARLDPLNGFAPDLAAAVEPAAAAVRMLALNYPNNPTGAVPSAAALAGMRRALGDATVWFNDATYAYMTYDGPPYSLLAPQALGAAAAPVLELFSLGKLFPLGPLATSFLVGDAATIDAVREYSEFAWSPVGALQVRLGRECLAAGEHLVAVREATRGRIERLAAVLGELGFDCFPVQGGLYQLCRAPRVVGGRAVAGAGEAAEALLAGHAIAAVPFEIGPDRYLRFSAQYLPQDLEGLQALARRGRLVQD